MYRPPPPKFWGGFYFLFFSQLTSVTTHMVCNNPATRGTKEANLIVTVLKI